MAPARRASSASMSAHPCEAAPVQASSMVAKAVWLTRMGAATK